MKVRLFFLFFFALLGAAASVAKADCGSVVEGGDGRGRIVGDGQYAPDGKCRVRGVSDAFCRSINGVFQPDRGAGHSTCVYAMPRSGQGGDRYRERNHQGEAAQGQYDRILKKIQKLQAAKDYEEIERVSRSCIQTTDVAEIRGRCKAFELWSRVMQSSDHAKMSAVYYVRVGLLMTFGGKYQEAIDLADEATGYIAEKIALARAVDDDLSRNKNNLKKVYQESTIPKIGKVAQENVAKMTEDINKIYGHRDEAQKTLERRAEKKECEEKGGVLVKDLDTDVFHEGDDVMICTVKKITKEDVDETVREEFTKGD